MKNVFDEIAVQAMAHQLLHMGEDAFPYKHNIAFAEMAGIAVDEHFPTCPFCKQAGLFATGNGGIVHTADCAITLARRLLAQ